LNLMLSPNQHQTRKAPNLFEFYQSPAWSQVSFSFPWPRSEGEIACHRTTVAGLVLKAARKRGVQVEIVEWPGGEPKQIDLDVTPRDFTSIRKGRMPVPLGDRPDLAEVAGLPWCSVATLHSEGEKLKQVVGPAIRQPGQWVLLVFPTDVDGLPDQKNEAVKLRRSLGLEPTSV
jgi:hypothetical protein